MTAVTGFFEEQEWTFAPHERSPLPGAPSNPDHPIHRRLLFAAIGVLIGLTAGVGTAIVSVNLPYLQGGLQLYQDEIAWLPAVYVMTNVPTGILLIKYRQQFGLRSFALIFQGLYCLLTLMHIFVGGFAAAVAVRAASGIAGSALTTLALNYLIQAFPAATRMKGIAIGISVPQLAIPLARYFSPQLIDFDQWHTLYLFEFGLAMLSFAAIAIYRLPPSLRERSFEALDLPTLVLFTGGISLVSAVLAAGRFAWWLDSAWIGWALVIAVPVFGAVFLIEFHRANPIIDWRWLGTIDFLRFVLVGAMARIVLSEQTYGTVGLLSALGYTNDQLETFSLLSTGAAVCGIAAGALIVGPNRLTQPVVLAIGIVSIAAAVDSFSTSLTRAPELYFTQALIAFSTTLYVGPAILVGFSKVLIDGGKKLTSFIGLFATTQSLGGLIGTALLGTYQSYREKQHSFDIVQNLSASNPQVAAAIAQASGRVSGLMNDPLLRSIQGGTALSQRVTIEANVLAYNDVFRLIAILAAITTLLLAYLVVHRWRLARDAALHTLVKAAWHS
jgi:MFS family permease